MRLFKILISVFLIVFLSLYILIFTSIGHGILLPIVENKIKDATKLQNVSIQKFDLSINSLDTTILLQNQPLNIDAKFDILSKDIDVDTTLDIKDLTKFQNLTKQKIKGGLFAKVKVLGKLDDMDIKGSALIAKGELKYDLKLKNNQPKDINFYIKDLDLEILLSMLSQPIYTKAKLTSTGKIDSIEPLNGIAKSTITDGVLNQKTIKEKFDINLPKNPSYNLKIDTKLQKGVVLSDIVLDSFVAKLTTQKTKFNINTQKLSTDYNLFIPKLQKLYFISNQKMRGDIKIAGDVVYDKKLLATFKSSKFGGSIDGKLDDNRLTLDTKDISTLDLLHMFYYPEIFKAKLKLDLDYNLASKKGIANFDMGNGRFLLSESIKMINTVLKKDISLEVYKIAKIKADINDNIINNDIYFQSKNIHIKSDKAYIDTKKQLLDSKFNIKYKKYSLDLKASGDLKDPKVKIDPKKVIKQKAKEKIVETIEKKLGEKLGTDIKGIFDNIFK